MRRLWTAIKDTSFFCEVGAQNRGEPAWVTNGAQSAVLISHWFAVGWSVLNITASKWFHLWHPLAKIGFCCGFVSLKNLSLKRSDPKAVHRSKMINSEHPHQSVERNSGHVPLEIKYPLVPRTKASQIEIMFGRLKDWWRVATRYDRCPKVFKSAMALAATILLWLWALSLVKNPPRLRDGL